MSIYQMLFQNESEIDMLAVVLPMWSYSMGSQPSS
jgi:hypothetical protein